MRNPSCYTTAPGEEPVLPWVSRAVETARTLSTLKEFLEEADLRLVENLLIECAKEADFQVNEREYGEGRTPDDAECDRVVGYDEKGKKVTRAMELGTMKHAVAFACVRQRLLTRFPENISIEPRYAPPGPTPGQSVLTDQWTGSLKPDIVLHFARNPTRIQCIFDFKFPCTLVSKSNPLGPKTSDVRAQLEKYDKLGGNCPSGIVTPQLGVNHE
ncbi:hypothetical protein F0U60_27700 [Archangium minus]|uniref:Lipoprotein n=1 Tax=Archangium minus TaxID=83450 RepID=A0ABY9XB56_9BACT|nr:hypothetical protein F0U60_27700 [Archangium minus]